MLSHVPLSVSLTLITICHMKYFMHPLPLNFFALLQPALENLFSLTLQEFFRDAYINKAANGSI